MKKLKIATIVFLGAAGICMCALLILALSGTGFGRGSNGKEGEYGADAGVSGLRKEDYALVLEKEFAPEDIRSLKIDYGMTFNDVYFYRGETESVLIREYMNFTPGEKQISGAEVNEGCLLVKGARRRNFGFFFTGTKDAYTEIYLPADMAGQMEEVYVKTVSGEIVSDSPLAVQNTFQISSTSGDICFPEVRAAEIRMSSTSGNIRVEMLQAVKTSVSTTSGDIGVGRAESEMGISSVSGGVVLDWVRGDTVVSTTSGDIGLGETEGALNLSSTSGNFTLERADGGIDVSTTSGDISLGEVEGDMDISSTSGIVRLRKGSGRFEGETSSGDIRLEELEGAFSLSTSSGDVLLASGKGWGTTETISGDVEIVLQGLEGDVTISTTSGNVDMVLTEAASFTLDFDSASGGCSTFFDEMLSFNKKGNHAEGQYGSGENAVRVSTTSGDLRMMK